MNLAAATVAGRPVDNSDHRPVYCHATAGFPGSGSARPGLSQKDGLPFRCGPHYRGPRPLARAGAAYGLPLCCQAYALFGTTTLDLSYVNDRALNARGMTDSRHNERPRRQRWSRTMRYCFNLQCTGEIIEDEEGTEFGSLEEWSRSPEPLPDASGILVRPLRAATGCEFEAASETGRVMQTGSDLDTERGKRLGYGTRKKIYEVMLIRTS
jgi:hypothetical protein